MNPGAVGRHGWHKVRTLLRFTLDAGKIKDLEVIEAGSYGVPFDPTSDRGIRKV